MIESQPIEILRVLAIELKYIYCLMYSMYPFHVIENCYTICIMEEKYWRQVKQSRHQNFIYNLIDPTIFY